MNRRGAAAASLLGVTAESLTLLIAQVAGTLGTLAAVVIATITVRKAAQQARDAEAAMLRDRRIDFQLGVIRELAQLNLRPGGSAVEIGHLKLLASMLPVELVPITRAVAGIETTWAAGEERDRTAEELKSKPSQDWDSYPVWGCLRHKIEVELLASTHQLTAERV